ncbi:Fpg/Nei family DNA glycosylase [Nesterenkonia xinjiangensis]|uniref:DNA-(apurinic or apyrimidinic site) lyase n=1 Tax=Nesterenkonia xinjiangensis TaxID=225327 RepID=A0A7Z0KCS6_9MICC|nr:Fpg/Nei family DNA glycosylase [Nesterenkonia xinjiangensis]NYJ78922.1 endonuclease-8 [Nesterenkonia xinjiangensis]
MPEGDSVFREAAMLHEALAGRTLLSTDFRVPAFATVDFSRQRVDRVQARGKHLLITVGDAVVHSHLKMEGTWHVYPRGTGGPGARRGGPRWKRPAHTARCVLTAEHHQAVGFSLGELHVFTPAEMDEHIAHLGPDLLGEDWNAADAARRMGSQPDRAIGVALLDQRNLAGVGNVYRSEICFLAGVHPDTPIGAVPDLSRIIDIAHRLLQINKLRGRRSTTGTPTAAVQYWVYGRGGKLCMRCQSRIIRSHSGEESQRRAAQEDRVIYVCPTCQPSPGQPS